MAEEWPDWPFRRDSIADLARYVDLTRAPGLIPSDCHGSWSSEEAGKARARQLYDALRDRRIVYANESWNPNQWGTDGEFAYQRVRGPEETIQGPATCLDLALLFAGFAIAADIRPLIGFRLTPTPHALVALDVSSALSNRHGNHVAAVPPGFIEAPDAAGIYHLRPGQDPASRAGQWPGWVLVDVSQAARARSLLWVLPPTGAPFDIAAEDGSGQMQDGRRYRHEWVLVDVSRVRADRAPYPPPTGRSVPAIHGYLPALPAFTSFPSRQTLLQDLYQAASSQLPVTVVLQGDSGLGKSMLAHRVAVAADHGCGWFLNATDAKALTRSLAEAERQEQSLRDEQAVPLVSEKPDYGEDKALAAAALARLREADRPWTVVVDNCDSAPDTAELGELMPRPARPGQVVIITTTDPAWITRARDRGWTARQLAGLETEDLRPLRLPAWAEAAANGKPLIAQALAALRPDAEAQLEASDGARLVWDLLRESAAVPPEAIAVARLLAWCPPEPVVVTSLLQIAGSPDAAASNVDKALADLRFVTSTLPDARIAAAVPDAGAATPRDVLAIQMHRLFATAVRKQTWEDEFLAADVIEGLLTNDRGRQLFIDAADSTALERLEGTSGEVSRAARVQADRHHAGLLWHGLGHIRERRGPVDISDEHFRRALELLRPLRSPFEVAECMIGRARLVFQRKPPDTALLAKARRDTEDAQELLTGMSEPDARQMREQANALSWLIEQVIAQREKDARKREALLLRAREELWQSYEKRLALARDRQPGQAADRKTRPLPADGLGAERAYYNLAGVNIQLAKTRVELAGDCAEGAAREDEAFDQARADLAEAAEVYAAVRALRERRYGGRPHPHLASCLHGQALVAYFRAALLRETGQLANAFDFEGVAMEQRLKVAGSLSGPGGPAALGDTDVRKSADFMMKMSVSGIAARYTDPDEAQENVTRIFNDAFGEWFGAPRRATG